MDSGTILTDFSDSKTF